MVQTTGTINDQVHQQNEAPAGPDNEEPWATSPRSILVRINDQKQKVECRVANGMHGKVTKQRSEHLVVGMDGKQANHEDDGEHGPRIVAPGHKVHHNELQTRQQDKDGMKVEPLVRFGPTDIGALTILRRTNDRRIADNVREEPEHDGEIDNVQGPKVVVGSGEQVEAGAKETETTEEDGQSE